MHRLFEGIVLVAHFGGFFSFVPPSLCRMQHLSLREYAMSAAAAGTDTPWRTHTLSAEYLVLQSYLANDFPTLVSSHANVQNDFKQDKDNNAVG